MALKTYVDLAKLARNFANAPSWFGSKVNLKRKIKVLAGFLFPWKIRKPWVYIFNGTNLFINNFYGQTTLAF